MLHLKAGLEEGCPGVWCEYCVCLECLWAAGCPRALADPVESALRGRDDGLGWACV